jgi:hypothetical protein
MIQTAQSKAKRAVRLRTAFFYAGWARNQETMTTMRVRRRRLTIATVAALTTLGWTFCGSLRPARAWNAVGHMVIGAIAEPRLNPAARANVARLLKINATAKTRTFAEAGCWLDDVRAQGIVYFDRWHYHNRAFSPDNTPFPAAPHEDNVAWAIETSVKALQSKYASPVEQARALRILIHTVEDIHQPLHCGSRYTRDRPDGDRGGNEFRLSGRGKIRNLHAFWDGGAGLFAAPVARPLPANGEPITTIAQSIAATYPAGTLPEQTDLSTQKWLDEGAALLSRVVYPASPTLDEAYVVRARETAKKRVALAGYRLAALLNTIWPEGGAPVPVTPPGPAPGAALIGVGLDGKKAAPQIAVAHSLDVAVAPQGIEAFAMVGLPVPVVFGGQAGRTRAPLP